MRLAVMQPYFLPYLGYFALVDQVDRFVVFDTAQFPRRGWVHRNRIWRESRGRGSEDDWAWFGVPIEKCALETPIRDVRLAATLDPSSLRETLRHGYARAPHFDTVLELLHPLWTPGNRSLLELDEALLRAWSGYLGLSAEWRRSSEWEAADDVERPPVERILTLCRRIGADTYWNLPGGRSLYDPSEFGRRGIELRFVPAPSISELAREFPGISALSVVHLAMFHDAETLHAMIRRWVTIEDSGAQPAP